jgi:ectoine hydroxylase-related dioxygenase (phytanoyl-CoA dioxygenase family)
MTATILDAVHLPSRLERDGFAIVPGVTEPATVGRLIQALENVSDSGSVRRRESVYGIRNLLDIVPEVRELAASRSVRALVEPVLGPDAFPVRGILFDKTPGANWNVVWHQDMTIAVQERRETPGFGPWSEKAGVTHVQPPPSILEGMLSLRLHLDTCDEDNGPLRVLPGSHRYGRLDAAATRQWRHEHPEVVCTVPTCGALLMRPLLLHASSDSRRPGHRRVIHIDFAAEDLPFGLRWHTQPRG